MDINEIELRESFFRAQNKVTDKLEAGSESIGEIKPMEEWEEFYRKGQKRKLNNTDRKRTVFRAAIIIFAMMVVSAASAFSVEASRKAIIHWFTERGAKQDDFHFEQSLKEEKKEPPQTIEKIYAPTYIPDGFEMADEMVVEDIYGIQNYEKGKHYITLEQDIVNAGIAIDSEDMGREDVMIQGYQGQLNRKKGKIILIWATGEYVFTLSSDLDREEVLKIAESIREKNKN